MDVDADRFAALLAARLAAIVPDGFHVTLENDMLWFRSDEGRFPGQQGDYHTGSAGIWPQEDFRTCLQYEGTAEECAADAARHALDALQDYVAEATHDPWPGQRVMPEPNAQVFGATLHLWYGAADDPVLACEPIPLGTPDSPRETERPLLAGEQAFIEEFILGVPDPGTIERSMGKMRRIIDDRPR